MMRRKAVRRKSAKSENHRGRKARPQVRRAASQMVEQLEERALMAVVGYYDASTASLSSPPDQDMSDVIEAAGHTAVRLTDANIGSFNFGTLDVLMIGTRIPNSTDASRPAALISAYPAIEAWVSGGGKLIVHDANPGSNSTADIVPGLDGSTFVGSANASTSDVSVLDPLSAVIDGPDTRDVTDTNLDSTGTTLAIANGYVGGTTLPGSVTRVLGHASDPNRVAVISYSFGGGYVIYSTIGAEFFASRPLTDTRAVVAAVKNIYIPNEIDAAAAGAPQNPDPSAGGPYAVAEGQSLVLSASHPSDPDGTLFSYAWDLDQDGQADVFGANVEVPWSTLSLHGIDDGAAQYSISLTMTDGQGNTSMAGAIVSVSDTPLTPIILAADGTTNLPATAFEGPLMFGASFSDFGDDMAVDYTWRVTKNGLSYMGAVGAPAWLHFDDEGSYVVTLTATDEDGVSASVSHSITVFNAAPVVDAGGDLTVNEGDSLAILAFADDPGSRDVVTVVWDVRDEAGNVLESGDGVIASFTPADNGTYTLTFTATDDDGGVGTGTAVISAANVAPVASIISAPATGLEGTSISLSGSASDAGSADTHTFAWAVLKDGVDYASGSGSEFTFTPDDNGTYRVTLTALDDDLGEAAATAIIEVGNVAPVASITSAPASGFEGSAVSVSGGVFDAGAADTHTFEWSVTKNGSFFTSGSGSDFSFIPDDNGQYEVTLTVIDDDLDSSIASTMIEIANVAPTASLESSGGGSGGDPVRISGVPITINGSATDPGTADTISYAWTVTKDGSPFASGEGAAISFRPNDEGTYAVSFTATDDDGGAGTVEGSMFVTVLPVSVQVSAEPLVIDENGMVTLSGAVSGGTNIGEYSVVIEWGDGTTSTVEITDGTFSVPHQYLDDGNGTAYPILVSAYDARGRTGTGEAAVMVENIVPAVQITNLTPGAAYTVGNTITLSGRFEDPGTLDAHRAEFVLTTPDSLAVTVVPATVNADGTVTASYAFTTAGVFYVTLNVYDDDGVGQASTVQGQDAFVVVSDGSTEGYALGGGWYYSAPGSYTPAPSLSGTAIFTCVVRYREGDTLPSGVFMLKLGDMYFRSSGFETFVVNGSKAQISGAGTINGTGGYRFRITVIDGKSTGTADRIRFRIWNSSGGVVYDSNIGADENGTLSIAGGNVVVKG